MALQGNNTDMIRCFCILFCIVIVITSSLYGLLNSMDMTHRVQPPIRTFKKFGIRLQHHTTTQAVWNTTLGRSDTESSKVQASTKKHSTPTTAGTKTRKTVKTITTPTATTTSIPRKSNITTNKKIIILYWTKVFSAAPPVNTNPKTWPFFYAGNDCPVKCELTVDKKRVDEASALVIHARNIDEMPPDRYKNKPWLLHTNENPVFTSTLRDPRIMSKMNYLVSYRLDSDFPCPEFVKPDLSTPVPFRDKKGLIIFATSHCEAVRTKYVSELMKYISVDSYGECLRNKQGLVGRYVGSNPRKALLDLQRSYKFALIFPNADCDYYMTEKIYSALSAGSVPVWMGTDKIDEALQWGNLEHSYIKVNNFSSPEKLAKYLKFLAGNEKEYNKYLKWKYEGFHFPKEYFKSPIGQWWDGLPLYCRVCMKIAEDPKGHNGLPDDHCDGEQARTMRKWLGHDRK